MRLQTTQRSDPLVSTRSLVSPPQTLSISLIAMLTILVHLLETVAQVHSAGGGLSVEFQTSECGPL